MVYNSTGVFRCIWKYLLDNIGLHSIVILGFSDKIVLYHCNMVTIMI